MNLKLIYRRNQTATHYRISLLSLSKVLWLLSIVILVTACGGGSDSPTPFVPVDNSQGHNDDSSSNDDSDEPLEEGTPDSDDGNTEDEDSGENNGDNQDSGDEPPTTMAVTKRSDVNTVGQGETAIIIYDVLNANSSFDVDYSIAFNGGGMSAYATVVSDLAAKTITLTAEIPDNVVQIGTVDFSLSITDEAGTTISLEHHLDVTNADAEPQLKQLQAYVNGMAPFLDLNEERLLVERFAKLHMMANPGDGAYNAKELERKFNIVSQSPLSATLSDSIAEAINLLAGYQDMDPLATEVEIQDFITAQRGNLQRYIATVTDTLQSLLLNLDGDIPPIPTDTVYISPENNTVSLFIGNPHLGQFNDETWSYSEDYQFMNDISFPANSTCTAL